MKALRIWIEDGLREEVENSLRAVHFLDSPETLLLQARSRHMLWSGKFLNHVKRGPMASDIECLYWKSIQG